MPDYVYALHDFSPEHDDEISFRAGERIEVVERDDLYGDGWWQGRNLAGKVGLFPQSYATPTPVGVAAPASPPSDAQSPSSPTTAGDIHTALQPLNEEPDTASVTSDTADHAKSENGGDGVMKATLTDVQKAIEQLGRNDRDGGGSFSFASTRDGDTTDHETDRDTDRETDKETDDWHKGTRHNLAEKARAAAERSESPVAPRTLEPPIEVELSDESDGEDDHDHFLHRDHSHISEEDEEEGKPEGVNGFSRGHSIAPSVDTTRPVSATLWSPAVEPSEEFIVPEPDETEAQTATARQASFAVEATTLQQPVEITNQHSPSASLLTPISPTSLTTPSTEKETPSITVLPKPEPEVLTSMVSATLPSPPPSSSGGHKQAAAPAPSTHPSEWSVEDVVEWAKSKNFDSGICAKFVEHEITGDVLLDLDVNLLKTELEIPAFGKRMRIANAIAELRRPPSIMSSSDHHHQRASSQSQSVPSSAHQSLNSPLFPFGNGNGIMNGHGNGQNPGLASLMSPESPPHTGDLAGSPMTRSFRRDSDPGSSLNVSVTDVDQSMHSGKAVVGLGLGLAAGTAGAIDASKTSKSRPSQLALSPSDGALSARAISGNLIPEEAEDQQSIDERAAMSENETAHALESRSKRRRIFGRSSGSSHDAKETASRNSKESPTPASLPASPSPSTTKKTSLEDGGSVRRARVQRPTDPNKGSDRLSLFGGIGVLGKSRKPPPRFSSYGTDDIQVEKSSRSLSRLYLGSHSSRKSSGRPSTADSSSTRRNDSSSFRKFDNGKDKIKENEKETTIDKEKERDARDPALLRKRTTSPSNEVPGRAAVSLKPGQSVLEQIGQPDHNGWMRKKGEHYNTWKLRYFVLRGHHLYYLRSNSKTETKIKGYINIVGYKVIVDENVNPGRYGFRLIHESDKTHFFSSDEQIVVREWMKALMKATIGRDYTKPVISSCNIPTIPLSVAQTMNPPPRPPSPTARDATQKALRRENPNQLSTRDARVLMGLPSPDANGAEMKESERARADSFFTLDTVPGAAEVDEQTAAVGPVPPRPTREARPASSVPFEASSVDADLVKWANEHLPEPLQAKDASGSLYGGLALFRLAEAVKGTPVDPPVPDSAFPSGPNDDRLDGLFKLFDFFLDNDIKMGSVSINDVRQGRRDKIVQLLRSLKAWEEKRKAIARSIGRGSAHAGPFMAVDTGSTW